MRTIPLVLGAALALLPGPSATPAGELPKESWRSVVYADRDPDTGIPSIKVNGYLLQQAGKPREFSFLSLWRYDVGQKQWQRVVAFPVEQKVAVWPEKRQIYSRKTDQTLVRLPAQVGLFWAEWKEDGRLTDTLVFSGPVLCNDIGIGDPPKGMIATCVPFPDRAAAMFVPDPKVHRRK